MILGNHYALELWIEDKELHVEQAHVWDDIVANSAVAADKLRRGSRVTMEANPAALAMLNGFLINSGHIR